MAVQGANAIFHGITPTSVTFYNLTPNSTYQLYYYASDMDMSIYQRVTPVMYFSANTTVAYVKKAFAAKLLIGSVIYAVLLTLI